MSEPPTPVDEILILPAEVARLVRTHAEDLGVAPAVLVERAVECIVAARRALPRGDGVGRGPT